MSDVIIPRDKRIRHRHDIRTKMGKDILVEVESREDGESWTMFLARDIAGYDDGHSVLICNEADQHIDPATGNFRAVIHAARAGSAYFYLARTNQDAAAKPLNHSKISVFVMVSP